MHFTLFRDRRALFVLATVIALALHVAFFLTPWHRLFPEVTRPVPIQTQALAAADLEAQAQSNLRQMVELDPSLSTSKEAPKDARFASDQNRTVEKETRASNMENVPRFEGRTGEGRFTPYGVGMPRVRDTAPTSDGERFDQFVEAPDLELGAQNLFSTVESQYFSFYQRLRAVHAPIWSQEVAPKLTTARPAVAYSLVFLAPDSGAFLDVRFFNSPPEWLEDSIRKAWIRTRAVPNPPQGLKGEGGYIEVPLSYHIGNY